MELERCCYLCHGARVPFSAYYSLVLGYLRYLMFVEDVDAGPKLSGLGS